MVGFWMLDVKPAGPVHENVYGLDPPAKLAERLRVLPWHIAAPPPATDGNTYKAAGESVLIEISSRAKSFPPKAP